MRLSALTVLFNVAITPCGLFVHCCHHPLRPACPSLPAASHRTPTTHTAGALADVEAAFALHVWPSLPSGVIASRPGTLLAGAIQFQVTVKGRGGHAAIPHLTSDPVVAAAAAVSGLQALVARETSPFDSAVISVTRLAGGNAYNVVPDEGGWQAVLWSGAPAWLSWLLLRLVWHTATSQECQLYHHPSPAGPPNCFNQHCTHSAPSLPPPLPVCSPLWRHHEVQHRSRHAAAAPPPRRAGGCHRGSTWLHCRGGWQPGLCRGGCLTCPRDRGICRASCKPGTSHIDASNCALRCCCCAAGGLDAGGNAVLPSHRQ